MHRRGESMTEQLAKLMADGKLQIALDKAALDSGDATENLDKEIVVGKKRAFETLTPVDIELMLRARPGRVLALYSDSDTNPNRTPSVEFRYDEERDLFGRRFLVPGVRTEEVMMDSKKFETFLKNSKLSMEIDPEDARKVVLDTEGEHVKETSEMSAVPNTRQNSVTSEAVQKPIEESEVFEDGDEETNPMLLIDEKDVLSGKKQKKQGLKKKTSPVKLIQGEKLAAAEYAAKNRDHLISPPISEVFPNAEPLATEVTPEVSAETADAVPVPEPLAAEPVVSTAEVTETGKVLDDEPLLVEVDDPIEVAPLVTSHEDVRDANGTLFENVEPLGAGMEEVSENEIVADTIENKAVSPEVETVNSDVEEGVKAADLLSDASGGMFNADSGLSEEEVSAALNNDVVISSEAAPGEGAAMNEAQETPVVETASEVPVEEKLAPVIEKEWKNISPEARAILERIMADDSQWAVYSSKNARIGKIGIWYDSESDTFYQQRQNTGDVKPLYPDAFGPFGRENRQRLAEYTRYAQRGSFDDAADMFELSEEETEKSIAEEGPIEEVLVEPNPVPRLFKKKEVGTNVLKDKIFGEKWDEKNEERLLAERSESDAKIEGLRQALEAARKEHARIDFTETKVWAPVLRFFGAALEKDRVNGDLAEAKRVHDGAIMEYQNALLERAKKEASDDKEKEKLLFVEVLKEIQMEKMYLYDERINVKAESIGDRVANGLVFSVDSYRKFYKELPTWQKFAFSGALMGVGVAASMGASAGIAGAGIGALALRGFSGLASARGFFDMFETRFQEKEKAKIEKEIGELDQDALLQRLEAAQKSIDLNGLMYGRFKRGAMASVFAAAIIGAPAAYGAMHHVDATGSVAGHASIDTAAVSEKPVELVMEAGTGQSIEGNIISHLTAGGTNKVEAGKMAHRMLLDYAHDHGMDAKSLDKILSGAVRLSADGMRIESLDVTPIHKVADAAVALHSRLGSSVVGMPWEEFQRRVSESSAYASSNSHEVLNGAVSSQVPSPPAGLPVESVSADSFHDPVTRSTEVAAMEEVLPSVNEIDRKRDLLGIVKGMANSDQSLWKSISGSSLDSIRSSDPEKYRALIASTAKTCRELGIVMPAFKDNETPKNLAAKIASLYFAKKYQMNSDTLA